MKMHDAEIGEPGEMLISGPQIMRGYFGDPEQNRGVLSTDDSGRTWLHTGDIATMDKDGFFYIVDRRKDMIIRSGLKVYPSKVERVLQTHKNVKEAAVFGRPDQVHTELVIAAVVLKKARGRRGDESRLRDLCREHLALTKCPPRLSSCRRCRDRLWARCSKTQLRQMPAQPQQSRGGKRPWGSDRSP